MPERFFEDGHVYSARGSTIIQGDNRILGYVHQSTGEISGVCSFQRCIGKTFTGTVSGDEVFQNGQAFFEVRFDRGFDNVSTTRRTDFGRFIHQSAQSAELFDLVFATTST